MTALAAAVGLVVATPLASQGAERDDAPPRANVAVNPGELLDRIAVLQFLGPHAQIVRAAVVDALVEGGGVELVPGHLVEGRLYPGGSPWTHGAQIARELRLLALIHGATARMGRGFGATLTVMGADGREVGRLTIAESTLPRLHGRIRAEVWVQVRPLLQRARAWSPPERAAVSSRVPPVISSPSPARPSPFPPAASETPTNVPPKVGAADPEVAGVAPTHTRRHDGETQPRARTRKDRPRRRARETTEPGEAAIAIRSEEAGPRDCVLANLELGGGVLLRAFNYRGEQRGALRGYVLSRAPFGRVEATLYPFARTCGVAGRLGVRLAYERMANIDSDLGGRSFSTEAFAYQAELVGRIVLGRWVLTPAAGYHARTYAVAEEVVPRVEHHALGGSLDVQRRVGILVLELGGGIRRLISAGGLGRADWFPGQTGTTYAGRLRVGGAMTDWLDLMLGVQVEYTDHDFHIQETGAYPNGVASGAHDTYLSTLLSLRLHLPGTTTSP